jgi:hypothetical protein
MPFCKTPPRAPDANRDGVRVWIDPQKGSVCVVVRLDDPEKVKLRLVETHSGPTGGEFRFKLKK